MPPRNSRAGKKTSPESIKAKRRAIEAVNLRADGKTFPEIAKILGYNSKQAAHDAVTRALKEMLREPCEEMVKLDLERLDLMWAEVFASAKKGDVQSLAACLKIMERRAKLLGMDAPARTESVITSPDGSMTPKITVEFVDVNPTAPKTP